MDTDAKREWVAPSATPMTDSESRADVADVWMQNGFDVSGTN